MGSRLLLRYLNLFIIIKFYIEIRLTISWFENRWVRQPLVDLHHIRFRQNVVHMFVSKTLTRNSLLDGPLNNLPDIEQIINK